MAQSAAAVPDPFDNFCTCLIVIGFGNSSDDSKNVHNINRMDNFAYIDTKDANKFMKMYNQQQTGANLDHTTIS